MFGIFYTACFCIVIGAGGHNAKGKEMQAEEMAQYRQRVKDMFYHAYNNYLENAFPYDELRPLTCDGQDTWGSFSLTLIDALDTLLVLGNVTEFQRVFHVLQDGMDFNIDVNASVFETNIRDKRPAFENYVNIFKARQLFIGVKAKLLRIALQSASFNIMLLIGTHGLDAQI
ncbi:ER degradation-enhancing alpha-mannosidase-like protein 2 [Rhincodon typus]|uniref:ER degradation-enhancing alpha-mannosidase-like protein 2 n=1 Tax=Rhincodon typus TaxID=259920 RepID=UPI00202E923A|nr:ER degradation-enhancing alpha-mannosidase-like protein 2 [Rhincodon typus]